MDSLLHDYHDKEVVEFLRYGWPANRLPSMPTPAVSFLNHKSATDHPRFVQKYLEKELALGAVMGPFENIPFEGG